MTWLTQRRPFASVAVYLVALGVLLAWTHPAEAQRDRNDIESELPDARPSVENENDLDAEDLVVDENPRDELERVDRLRDEEIARRLYAERLRRELLDARVEGPVGLGVTVIDDGKRRVFVSQVFPDSPAHEAGLRVNDEIVEVGGLKIDSVEELRLAIRRKKPGAQIGIRILRDGRRRTLFAQLEPRFEAFTWADRRLDGDLRSPVWADRDFVALIEHVDRLERRVLGMADELADLRALVRAQALAHAARHNVEADPDIIEEDDELPRRR